MKNLERNALVAAGAVALGVAGIAGAFGVASRYEPPATTTVEQVRTVVNKRTETDTVVEASPTQVVTESEQVTVTEDSEPVTKTITEMETVTRTETVSGPTVTETVAPE